MRYLPRTIRALRLVAAPLLLVAVFGCGDAPTTAPVVVTTPEAPPVLAVSESGTVTYLQTDSLLAVPQPIVGSRALTVSKEIDGTKGGWIECGRFVLAVPAGAYDTLGTITMSMRDSTALVVDLSIAPARLNGFKAPVVLASNTTGLDVAPDSLAIYWYDPSTTKWVDMTSVKTLQPANDCIVSVNSGPDSPPDLSTSSGLTSCLSHFSKYSTGKAGW